MKAFGIMKALERRTADTKDINQILPCRPHMPHNMKNVKQEQCKVIPWPCVKLHMAKWLFPESYKKDSQGAFAGQEEY